MPQRAVPNARWVRSAAKLLACVLRAGERMNEDGMTSQVIDANWGGVQVAIKVPAKSFELKYTFDEAHSLLQHEEDVYRYLHSRLEGAAGEASVLFRCPLRQSLLKQLDRSCHRSGSA